MKILFLSVILFTVVFATEITNNGFLNVNSVPTGLKIYLEGDLIGTTPIRNYSLKPGDYSVSLFSSDTIEEKYWKLTVGGISSKLSSLWDLTKVGAATERVEINPNRVSEVFFSMQKVNRAPTRAKIATACCVGAGFSVAVLLGVLIANLAK